MATTSPLQSIPLPEVTDPVNVPSDLSLAVGDLESRVVMRFSSAGSRDSVITSPVEGMLAWLNDVNRLSIYDGAVWRLTGLVMNGLSSARPSAASVPEGTLYYETDNDVQRVRQGSAGSETWKVINYARAGTKANRPAAANVPTGTLYYETDNDLLRASTGSAWTLVNGKASYGGNSNDPSALTINATERTMVSYVMPTEAEVARKVLVSAFTTLVTSDATSVYAVRLYRNSSSVALARVQGPSGGGPVTASLAAAASIADGAGSGERTWDLTAVRISGSGTASGFAHADAHKIQALIVPA